MDLEETLDEAGESRCPVSIEKPCSDSELLGMKPTTLASRIMALGLNENTTG